MMNNVAIILARQNSKGIPLKNLQLVGGVSLLARTIKSAIDSGIFSCIIVSTDGDEIIKEAKKFPAVTIVKRPDNLANDTASSIDGMIHALQELKLNSGICCLLQPTSPLRHAKHIKQAYQLFAHQNHQGSVISACQANHHPYKTLILNENNDYQPVHMLSDLEAPRQTLPQAFTPNGAIYFNQIETLIKNQRFFNMPITLYQMNHIDSIDIDSTEDLLLANQFLKKR